MADAPDKEGLLETWRRVVPDNYRRPIETDTQGSFALFRGAAQAWAELAENIEISAQSTFYLPHEHQTQPSASSAVRATMSVVLNRALNQDLPVLATPGAMRLEVLNRTYTNRDTIQWFPFETAQKTAVFESEVAGTAGNVPYPIDEDGALRSDRIAFVDQDRDRTNIEATISGAGTTIEDTGAPDVFESADEGLYAIIANSAHTENINRIVRIAGFSAPGIEKPTGSNLFPRKVTVDVDKTFRIDSAQADDGGALTDETSVSRSPTTDDITLLPSTVAVADAYYFGHFTENFSALVLEISTAGKGDWTIQWEYFDGASFVALSDVDDSAGGFRVAGQQEVTWTVPGDWATTTINGVVAFYVRARVSAVTTTTTQPLGTRAHIQTNTPLISETDSAHWAILEWEGDLGVEVVSATLPAGGRDNDLFILGRERGVSRQDGETDAAFAERASKLADVVSPNAVRRIVNRQLAPFDKRGLAIDVQIGGTPLAGAPSGGFTGLFHDSDAFDYYGSGDAFPDDPWKLLLGGEALCWFFVVLPKLSGGEFGGAHDESPVNFIDPPEEFVDGAFGSAFMDGFPVETTGIYKAVYNAVDAVRAGGVGFTMLLSDDL